MAMLEGRAAAHTRYRDAQRDLDSFIAAVAGAGPDLTDDLAAALADGADHAELSDRQRELGIEAVRLALHVACARQSL